MVQHLKTRATLSDLKKISVHFPDQFNSGYKPEMLPSLAEVMHLFNDFPDAIAMVEIKQESMDKWRLEPVMEKLLQALQPWHAQCCIISFSLDAIDYVSSNSDYSHGWVLSTYDDASHKQAKKLQPDYLICNYKKVDSVLWPGGWTWMVYDIVEPSLAKDWYKAGADLVETANIEKMLKKIE